MATNECLLILFYMSIFATIYIELSPIEDYEPENQTLSRSTRGTNMPSYGIQFNTPDINVKHTVKGVLVQLQAYKLTDSSNEWVSIGYPIIIKNKRDGAYDFNPDGITFDLQLLPGEQEAILEKAARKRNPSAGEAFISLIPLQSLTCRTSISSKGKHYEILGEANNLDKYKVTIEAKIPQRSKARLAFEAVVESRTHLRWKCRFIAGGEEEFLKRIQIEKEDVQDIVIEENLFGHSHVVYLTRRQLILFAQKVRKRLTLNGEYQLDETFDEKFVERLINAATVPPEDVQIDQLLDAWSTFGIPQRERHIIPIEVKAELSYKMFVNRDGENITISLKNEWDFMSDDQKEPAEEIEVTRSIIEIFGIHCAIDILKKNREDWRSSGVSIVDQLRLLNRACHNQVVWEIRDSFIAPKTVKAVLFSKKDFERNFSVSYNKKVWKKAQFQKEITLTTKKTQANDEDQGNIKDLVKELAQLNMTVNALGKLYQHKVEKLEKVIRANEQGLKEISKRNVPIVVSSTCLPFDSVLINNGVDSKTGRLEYSDSMECRNLGIDYFIQIKEIKRTTSHMKKTPAVSFHCCKYNYSLRSAD